jgi:hypothetical protein
MQRHYLLIQQAEKKKKKDDGNESTEKEKNISHETEFVDIGHIAHGKH